MSFVEFLQDDPLLTREQVMAIIIQVADELDMPDKRGAAIVCGMAVDQEVGVEDNAEPHERRFWCPANHADPESFNYDHDSISDDGRSCGWLQQQKGPDGELWWGPTSSEMDCHSAVTTFMSRLKKAGYNASNAQTANDSAQAIQGSGVPDAYGQWWDDINRLYDEVSAGVAPPPPKSGGGTVVNTNKPSFNEFPIWTQNCGSRNGSIVDLFLIHTQEGGGGNSAAEDLANYFNTPQAIADQVSYHYTVSQASDGGVTVVDCVDTDLESWSVGDDNARSINACFAGSSVNDSHEVWMSRSNAIDVMAYLAVQDCAHYGITPRCIVPDYSTNPPTYPLPPPGISDHRYVTVYLGWGTHTDTGGNFPWEYFAARVAYWVSVRAAAPSDPGAPVVTPPPVTSDPPPVVTPTPFVYPSQEEMVKQIWEQFFGYQAKGYPSLFGNTGDGTRGKYTVEGIADIFKKVEA